MKTVLLAIVAAFVFASATYAQSSDPRCWYAFKKGVHSTCVDGDHENRDHQNSTPTSGPNGPNRADYK